MTKLGVTGHQEIPDDAVGYVAKAIRETLATTSRPLEGFSSLAIGADQLFAKALLAAGGELHAVIPCAGYESTFSDDQRPNYERLLTDASHVTELGFPRPSEEAFDAAGKWIAENATIFLAVWDGLPARGLGGTADAVKHARNLGRDVRIIWPEGVSRT
jgi:hypothetical protein